MHKRVLSKDEQEWILSKFKEHNIIEIAKKEAFSLVNEAIELMKSANEKSLEAIAIKMVDRSF
jgi:geranylgeranyl pyrophosphate synthase